MRNLVITENITLEGVVDASEGWFAPVEEMLGYTNDKTGVTEYLTSVEDIVVTGSR
jgi:hypothetical protein